MHGLLVIDKAAGLSSHGVVSRLRRLLGVRRVGHTGTLDPMATGVLPVAVGEGTRVIPFLREETKVYRATIQFGAATDTQDAEGTIVFRGSLDGIDLPGVEDAIARLTGELDQLPPMYSAIKQNGVPLYKLARKGEEVERKRRRIVVQRWEIEQFDGDSLTCVIHCSRGTYIRTLAHDLGELLGCGAHLTALRRLQSGPFTIAEAVTLEQLEERLAHATPFPWLSLTTALSDRPRLELSDEDLRRLLDGIPPASAAVRGVLPAAGEEVALVYGGTLVALARFAPAREREARGDFELLRVFNQVREEIE